MEIQKRRIVRNNYSKLKVLQPTHYRRPSRLGKQRNSLSDHSSGLGVRVLVAQLKNDLVPPLGLCLPYPYSFRPSRRHFSAARTSAPDGARKRPCRRPSVKGNGCEWDVRYAPAAQVLIECDGVLEHARHVRDVADVPRPNVPIECIVVVKHCSLRPYSSARPAINAAYSEELLPVVDSEADPRLLENVIVP